MSFHFPSQGNDLVDRYRLGPVLGEGASSLVFEAQDLKLDRTVAVKILKPQRRENTAAQRDRFLKEARLLAKLAHPHVIPVFDVGESTEGSAFFVMELVGARSLSQELEARGSLSLEETLALLLPLMGALSMAHDMGIVHRDLKPANIVLEGVEGTARAKLLDFGIAKFSNIAKGDTNSEHALGTPAYMAPEQARAEAVGPTTDVWSMGILLFRCLSGRLPFDAATITGVLLKIVNERAPSFREACPNLPARVAVVLDQALEPATWARPQDMREFARRLAQACRQDNVLVPRDPDPRALPLFPVWLQETDVEQTACALPPQPEASVPLAAPQIDPMPLSARPKRTLVASIVLALLSLILTFHMFHSHGDAPEALRAPVVHAEAAPDHTSTQPKSIDRPIAPIASDLASEPPQIVPPSSHAPQSAKLELPPKPPSEKRTAKRPNTVKAGKSQPTPPQLIKEWDW